MGGGGAAGTVTQSSKRAAITAFPDVKFDAPDITLIKYNPMNVFYFKIIFYRIRTKDKVKKEGCK